MRERSANAAEVQTPPAEGLRSAMPIAKGTILGQNYEIGEVLGSGGMAVVYRARQLSLNRPVALKVLHSSYAEDAEFVQRFTQESGALAALGHPNIVNIIDRGSDGKLYYFVMELVEGPTLDRKILDNTLTAQDWRTVVQSCRDALEYIHRRGVVHLDIKPSNILVDPEGHIKISDFGIAHIVEGGADEGERQRLGTRPLGTGHYMAPEQSATPDQVDQRADIFALAVTFYKMMARRMPDPASPVAPSEANHEIPIAVDAVLFRAMAQDRDDRYPNVREFCDDLLKAMKDSSRSLASILDYRTPTQGTSALYSGADFMSPVPVPGSAGGGKTPSRTSSASNRKLESDTGNLRKSSETKVPALPAAAPPPPPKGDSSSATKTAAPVPQEAAKKISTLRNVIVAIAVLCAVLLSALVYILVRPKQAAMPRVLQEEVPVSPTLERERRLEEARRREREALSSVPPADGSHLNHGGS